MIASELLWERLVDTRVYSLVSHIYGLALCRSLHSPDGWIPHVRQVEHCSLVIWPLVGLISCSVELASSPVAMPFLILRIHYLGKIQVRSISTNGLQSCPPETPAPCPCFLSICFLLIVLLSSPPPLLPPSLPLFFL